MRITILSALFALLLQPAFAASVPVSRPDTVNVAGDQQTVNAPIRKPLYEKGKGTMGLLAGAVLGPVGYFAVRFSSHNRTMRKQAEKGLTIWATVILTTAFIVLIVFSLKSGHGSKTGFKDLGPGGSGGSSGPSKKKQPTAEQFSHLPLFPQP
jgi:hypothetical protein